jgi:hypothetical protein
MMRVHTGILIPHVHLFISLGVAAQEILQNLIQN